MNFRIRFTSAPPQSQIPNIQNGFTCRGHIFGLLARPSTGSAPSSGDVVEEACLELGALDPSDDEDDPRSMIGIGPGIEQHGWMKNVMHTVNGHRRPLADQVEDALH